MMCTPKNHKLTSCDYCTQRNSKETGQLCPIQSRSKSRSVSWQSTSKYCSLRAAAAFLLSVSSQANADAHNQAQGSVNRRFGSRRLSAFVSRSTNEERCPPTFHSGDLESACGFTQSHFATLMETEADTETDVLWNQKKAKLQSSIKYHPYDYNNNKKVTNSVTTRNDFSMSDAQESVQSFTRERKVQLTAAINNVWKLDSKNKKPKNGYRKYKYGYEKNGSSGKALKATVPPPSKKLTIRNLWKRRHAQSIEEGIRRERVLETKRGQQLSEILDETTVTDGGQEEKKHGRYVARTLSGLISALAEEATGLEVEVDARNDTPLWKKQIDAVEINFSRLGVQALRMGGLDEALMDMSDELTTSQKENMADSFTSEAKKVYNEIDLAGSPPSKSSSDEIFDRIDVDNSGSLDEEELTHALNIASGLSKSGDDKPSPVLSKLVSRLINLYDTNGDGVVDREEYRKLVEDMSEVRNVQRMKQKERDEKKQERLERKGGFHPLRLLRIASQTFQRWPKKEKILLRGGSQTGFRQEDTSTAKYSKQLDHVVTEGSGVDFAGAQDISNDASVVNTISKGDGSILFSDLKLDLRRLLFGAVPFVKRITPGGPLILEPFTMSLKGSFTKEDILESGLLDDGLKRLVARALRRRVRSIRDLLDGALFFGRKWNMASREAPVVEVPKLIDIEFDSKDRLIITGRAKIRTAPDQPFVENSFKLRTKIGTRENGQYIRLEDPELALILECPKAWERNIVSACKNFDLPIPERPEPLYRFVPLVSPIKKTEQDGFNLGDDNRIQKIYAKDNALRFEMSCVLRPGRFLGNHYLAFTLPNRTFIITMDRIRNGIRTARQNKRELERSKKEFELSKKKEASDRYNRAVAQALSTSSSSGSNVENLDLSYKKEFDEDLTFADPPAENTPVSESEIVPNNRPGFFGRFLEGYLEAAREETEKERNERLTTAISEFFSPDSENEASEISNKKI